MPKPPVIKPREICRVLESMGFALVGQRGWHMQDRHIDGRCTTIPIIPAEMFPQCSCAKSCKDIGLMLEQFLSRR